MSGMLGQRVGQFGEKLVRKRPLEPREESEIPTLHPNILNLVLFGVNTPKARIYILAGAMAVSVAGPAIIISFLVFGLFSLLSGFFFGELVARVPRSGSVYLYSYVTMGQLHAFITGWNLILHLGIATACVTRAWSYTFDSLIGNHISQVLEGTFSEHVPSFLSPYPDIVALVLVLVMTGKKGSELSWEAWTVNGGARVGRLGSPNGRGIRTGEKGSGRQSLAYCFPPLQH
uniref:Amino acid permease/ SLC12A domain-containing protein n=1 Tax=Sus scrofa TaxID=9823 RepID=A0A8D0NQC3_PIG